MTDTTIITQTDAQALVDRARAALAAAHTALDAAEAQRAACYERVRTLEGVAKAVAALYDTLYTPGD